MKKHINLRPYIAGALVGVLATLSVIVSTQVLGKTQFLGASTTFVRGAGFIEQSVNPEHVKTNPYFIREKVKVDRVACPWLIRKFIDHDAEFLFVPADRVPETAEREGAIPFDVPGAELGHHEG